MSFELNGQPIYAGRSFVDADGNQYPRNWTSVLTQEQKDALGIVWVPDPAPVDTRFYWDHNLPRRLEDEPAVDENGDPVLDEDGQQIINTGLKTQWIRQQKEASRSLLAPTDWYVTRKSEVGTDVPTEVHQYRDDIRHASGFREDQIKQTSTFDQFVALVTNSAEIYFQAQKATMPNPEPHLIPWPKAPF